MALLVAAQPILAQPPEPPPFQRALVAGYHAGMLCSGLFNAGRAREQVAALELDGIYPDYETVPVGPVEIDRARGVVTVGWSDTMPPRRADWHRGTGCTTMPIGAAPPPIAGSAPPTPAGADPRAWPLGDAGIAPRPSRALAAAVDRAFTDAYGGRTVGVVIVRDGRIVAERYADGFGPFVSNRTWSVAKSLAGAAIGHAQLRGLIDVGARVRIPEWRAWPYQDLRASLTTDQLLRMASGLHSDTAGNRTDMIYFGGGSVRQDATQWPLEAAPGTRFRYANNDILLAVHGLRAAMRDDRAYAAFVPGFFARLGMTHTVAEIDWGGDYVLSSQVWSTARDLARFGLFMLQDGVWNGERLLPEGWMDDATRPSGPQPDGDAGYGRTLWLHGPRTGLPAGSYAAQGNRGQWIMVVPAARLVIVRRGEDRAERGFDGARFAADIVAVVR